MRTGAGDVEDDLTERGEISVTAPLMPITPGRPARESVKDIKKVRQHTRLYQASWVFIWTLNNISVTLINKASFSAVDFKYPYTLSAIHMLVCIVGSNLYLRYNTEVTRRKLDKSGNRFMFLFSLPFSANIVLGNVSLQYVSISFNQIMRSLVPVVCMAIEYFFFSRSYSAGKRRAVVPLVVGVALACYGDVEFSALGFFVTALLVVMAAVKVVISGHALTGEWKLHPVDLLARMAPLCFIQMLLMGWAAGELNAIWTRWDALAASFAWPVVLLSGLLAFSLNICSLLANKATSPLTLTVVANVKQVLMIVLSTVLYRTPVTLINALGVFIVIIGSARYSLAGLRDAAEKVGPPAAGNAA